MYNECCSNAAAPSTKLDKRPIVSESLGNLNSVICDNEKLMADLWQRLVPIRKCQPVEAKKELAIPNRGVPLADEIDQQVKRLCDLNKGILALLQEIEI